MIQKDFSNRLNELIEYFDLTAATFADKIGVPRSSISHILSGRNNPSLDFVLKIMSEFVEVDFNWLVLGKGSFPSIQGVKLSNTTLFDEIESVKVDISAPAEVISTAKAETTPATSINDDFTLKNSSKEIDSIGDIERIVVFFTNGTFKNYSP